jgi:tetratricopeptide (TPR) repeat protein
LAEAHVALAHVLLIERDYDGALRELNIAGAGLPNSWELFRLIGGLERRRGRWGESLAALTRAFEIDPAATADDIAVHYLLLRQYSEAQRFTSLLKASNRGAVAEAWALFSVSGDIAAARGILEPALGTGSGQDSRIRGLLARLEWFDGRNDRALELIDGMDPAGAWLPANFRFPAALASAQVYDSMNQRREATTRYATAAAALEEKLRSAPDDYQVEGALGLAYAGLGRGVDAVRHGERALTLLPLSRDAAESPLQFYLLAQIHARLGHGNAALARLDEMFSVPGFYSVTWIDRDPGFAPLRADARYKEYVARWSAQSGSALVKPSASRPAR